MPRPGLLFILSLTITASCASAHVDDRLAALEQEEQVRMARLDELEVQIASAERRVTQAQADAQFQECRATRTRLEAEVMLAHTDCAMTVARHSACVAKNESRTTKGAGLGCGLGWAAALLTGGAAAPAVLVGCAGGAMASHATRSECGDFPACVTRIKNGELASDVLYRHGHSSMPVCHQAVARVEDPEPSPPADSPHPEPQEQTCEAWRVDWVDFRAPPQKRSGDTWDRDGSEPDLMYKISVDGQRVYRSPKHEASAWRHTPKTTVQVSSGQDLLIELVDKDFGGHERIASFRGKLPKELPSQALTLVSGRATAQVQIACFDA